MGGFLSFKNVQKNVKDNEEKIEKIDMKELMKTQDQQELDPKDVGKVKVIGGE